MKRFILLILDGFGVGAMKDVPTVRPDDTGANTCLHILQRVPGLRLPGLQRLGLGNLLGSQPFLPPQPGATFGKAKLAHFGADTFFGHQEIMGTVPKKQVAGPLGRDIEQVDEKLRAAGFATRRMLALNGGRMLVVNNAAIVADNVDTDPGQVYNISAALDLMPFDEVLRAGRILRAATRVPRVIALGGHGIGLDSLLAGVRELDGGYVGVCSPQAGVYNEGYQCIHMGYGINPAVQLPAALAQQGIPSVLLGKAADVIENTAIGTSISCVETQGVVDLVLQHMQTLPHGLLCANVQETDLAGHSEDANRFADVLRIADAGILLILERMQRDDILCVMADHGNDPTIGHNRHTRECVPLLLAGQPLRPAGIGTRQTTADVARTALEFFGCAGGIEGGSSFWAAIAK